MKAKGLLMLILVTLGHFSCDRKEQRPSAETVDSSRSKKGNFLNNHSEFNFKKEKSTDFIIIYKDSIELKNIRDSLNSTR
jgi:hypothetical protein